MKGSLIFVLDLVVGAGGRDFESEEDIRDRVMAAWSAGQSVDLVVERDGKRLTIPFTMDLNGGAKSLGGHFRPVAR